MYTVTKKLGTVGRSHNYEYRVYPGEPEDAERKPMAVLEVEINYLAGTEVKIKSQRTKNCNFEQKKQIQAALEEHFVIGKFLDPGLIVLEDI